MSGMTRVQRLGEKRPKYVRSNVLETWATGATYVRWNGL